MFFGLGSCLFFGPFFGLCPGFQASLGASLFVLRFLVAGVGGCFAQFLRYLVFLHLFFKESLDGTEGILILFSHEGDGLALGSCACGTSDAVNVILGIMGHVEIYHELDVIDVYATRDNIGGNEDVHLL